MRENKKKRCIIACESIRPELELVKKNMDCHFPVLWLPMGLHNTPAKLRQTLSEKISEAGECEWILFGMGFCTKALKGISSPYAGLVLPRVDDCISLLLGSSEQKIKYNQSLGTYFFSKGWLNGEKNLWKEYEHLLERYGSEKGERIMRSILSHYKRIALVDTGVCPVEELLPMIEKMSARWNLKHEVLSGNLLLLYKLLTGNWNEEEFYIIPRGKCLH